MGYRTTTWIRIAFALVGVGNGLIDVYLNVAGQRAKRGRASPSSSGCMRRTRSVASPVPSWPVRSGPLDIDFRIGLVYAGLVARDHRDVDVSSVPRGRRVAGTQTLLSISALFREPTLLVPAVVVLGSFLIEGSMDVWSGLYLRDQLGASATGAAVAFVAFASAVLVGRLFAGRVLFGMGRRMTILVAVSAR